MIYKTKDSIANWMKDSAIPALHITSAESKAWSKIGGLPNLEIDQTWPSWKEKPLSFLAQLDFAEMSAVASLPNFPTSGRIWFFYDQEQSTWGFDPKDEGSWTVLFRSVASENNVPITTPDGINEHGLYLEKHISFRAIQSLPDFCNRITFDLKALNESDFDELEKLKSACYEKSSQHQIGGYPLAQQNDTMELECQLVSNGLYCGDSSGYKNPRRQELESGAADWILLFQLDTDDDAGMMWGDVGMLYFWIRRQDILRSDFSKVWMTLQCG